MRNTSKPIIQLDMHNTQIIKLPTYIATEIAIEKIAPMGSPVCLSGSWGKSSCQTYYDIISSCPSEKLKEQHGILYIDQQNTEGEQEHLNIQQVNALDWLNNHLSSLKTSYIIEGESSQSKNLPLIFGFIGYISYDYSKNLESLPCDTINDTDIPDFCGGIYHWNFINDSHNQASYIAFGPYCSNELQASVLDALKLPSPDTRHFQLISRFSSNSDKAHYQRSFDQIKQYIDAGDCYQINFSHRFQAQYTGPPLQAFSYLRNKLNTPYSAFLDLDDHQIISLSPERFIKINGNDIETKPIKGTIKRGNTVTEDRKLIKALKDSKKDKAENLMIVDLLRNDLNRSCIPGTVKVPELFKIETYPNVHHLVSTVIGEKTDTTSSLNALKQAFPGGSITGAPKIRAMEIIEELEPTRRSIYCGSVFYSGFDGNIDSNICIRTLLCKKGDIYCWGGGGIVSDSNCKDEHQESITKVKNLMDELEKVSRLK